MYETREFAYIFLFGYSRKDDTHQLLITLTCVWFFFGYRQLSHHHRQGLVLPLSPRLVKDHHKFRCQKLRKQDLINPLCKQILRHEDAVRPYPSKCHWLQTLNYLEHIVGGYRSTLGIKTTIRPLRMTFSLWWWHICLASSSSSFGLFSQCDI